MTIAVDWNVQHQTKPSKSSCDKLPNMIAFRINKRAKIMLSVTHN